VVKVEKIMRVKAGEGNQGAVWVDTLGRAQKRLKPFSLKNLSAEHVRASEKTYKALKQAGCTLPNNMKFDAEKRVISWDNLGPTPSIHPIVEQPRDPKYLERLFFNGDKFLTRRIARELARIHSAGYVHSHNPLSSMHAVEMKHGTVAVVADLGNITKARLLSDMRTFIDFEDSIKLVPTPRLKNIFAREYLKHNKKKGVRELIDENYPVFRVWADGK